MDRPLRYNAKSAQTRRLTAEELREVSRKVYFLWLRDLERTRHKLGVRPKRFNR